MTLDEMAYEVLELIRREIVDDEHIDLRLIKQLIKEERATYIKNEFNKGNSLVSEDEFSQDLGIIDLESIDSSYDVPNYPTAYDILRTISTIPMPIYIKGLPKLVISPKDMVYYKYKIVDHDNIIYTGYGRFNSKVQRAFLWNSYVHIIENRTNTVDTDTAEIHVRGIFNDPTDVLGFIDATSEFPFPERYWKYIRDSILNLLRNKDRGLNDTVNNSNDDYVQAG
jgi:hypothetical protein